MDSPFEVLGVDPDADDAEVDRAYRRRVKETHPDQGGSAEAFRAVRAAYEAITSGAADDVRAGGTAGGSESPDEGTAPSPPSKSRVEYLDYDVLADYGWGLDDEGLFEKAADADLDPADHGRVVVEPEESLLEAAECRGFAWPFACRGGACANCAVAVREGELSMPVNHVLPREMLDRGYRLSCNGVPATDEMKVVFNVKHLPGLDDLRLPPDPFERTYAGD